MIKNFLKKYKGFTVNELVIVITIVGFIMTVTAVTTINNIGLDEKATVIASKNFYSTMEDGYKAILKAAKKDNITIKNMTSANLRDYILNYFDGKEIECDFPNLDSVSSSGVKSEEENEEEGTESLPVCAKLISGIEFAAFVDNSCSTSVNVIEYRVTDGMDTREVNNACGYIAYKTKKSTGTFGVDFFSLALGSRSLR